MDSLRLFTPAQYSGLPGMAFPSPNDTYPSKDDVAAYLQDYASAFDLPVRLNTRVTSLTRRDGGYLVSSAGERRPSCAPRCSAADDSRTPTWAARHADLVNIWSRSRPNQEGLVGTRETSAAPP